jgi:SOS response regulatory protein OraA/RecX
MVKVQLLKKVKSEYEVSFLLENETLEKCLVSEDLVVTYRLLQGKELTKDSYLQFRKDLMIDGFFHKAISYVLKYHKSEAETIEYLEKKECTKDEVSRIIEKLKKLNIINDEILIQSIFDVQIHQKRVGPAKLEYLLKEKGFEESLIKKTLFSIKTEDINTNLDALFQKKLISLKHQSISNAKRLAISYLYQKGYDLNMVQAYVISHQDAFPKMIDEEKGLKTEYFRLLKRLDKTELSSSQKSQKIISSLMAKGYPYKAISKILERGQFDER